MYKVTRILPVAEQIEIVCVGDAHDGNPNCRFDKLQKQIDYIEKTKNCYMIGMGDLMECILPSDKRYDAMAGFQTIDTIKQRIKTLLEPIKDKILIMLSVTEDTKVLTDKGWRHYTELTLDNKVISLNLKTDKLEYTNLTGIHPKDYEGEIIKVKTKTLDQQLTPDHRVLLLKSGPKKYKYKRAGDLTTSRHLKIPIIREFKNIFSSDLTSDEVRFLGWVIAEGHIDYKRSKNPVIEITQSVASKHTNALIKLFKRLNLQPSHHFHKGRSNRTKEKDWVVYYFSFKQIKKYIDILGGEKEIPRKLLELPKHQLKILYKTLMDADGCRKTYYTANLKLAEQVLELLIKIGYSGSIIKREREQLYSGYKIPVSTIGYSVTRHAYKNRFLLKINKAQYKGKVFCLSTGNGNFLAMRNGKIFLTGNTGNHELKLAKSGYGDPMAWLCQELRVKYGGISAFLKLRCFPKTHLSPVVFFLHHGWTAGRQTGNTINNLERLAQYWEADVYCIGHSHKLFVSKRVRVNIDGKKTLLFVNTGTFLETASYGTSGYSELAGYPPLRIGSPKIKWYPTKRDGNTLYASE